MTQIAILIPCFNESQTLEQVIHDFKQQLPQAHIYVYDNDSTDNSINLARSAKVFTQQVSLHGKGQVVRRMFADVSADIYVIVDGDATYDASVVGKAIALLEERSLDMVVCTRDPTEDSAFPFGHKFGNKWFTRTVNFLFNHHFEDIFSGYRIFSRRFVKSFPVISQGFEIEAEITIHALQLGLPTAEIKSNYRGRPPGSSSKLDTVKDGLRILRTIFLLFLYIRPMALFGLLFLIFMSLSLILGTPIVIFFLKTGLAPKMPTTILAPASALLGTLCLACGIILDSISRSRLEAKRCWYLMHSR